MTDTNMPASKSVPASPTDSYADAYKPPASATDQGSTAQQAMNVVDEPPVPTQASPVSSQAQTSGQSQALEDQNIFDLLGITDATDEEKEEFLDELQQVIWDDFVENDLELLLTQEEMEHVRQITDKVELKAEEQQSQIIEYIDPLVPDLEKIMLDKAMELKSEMVNERMKDLREDFANDSSMLGKLQQAEQLIKENQWRAAADVLNSIPV